MKSFSDLDNLGTSSPQIIPPIHPSAALAGQRGASGAFANNFLVLTQASALSTKIDVSIYRLKSLKESASIDTLYQIATELRLCKTWIMELEQLEDSINEIIKQDFLKVLTDENHCKEEIKRFENRFDRLINLAHGLDNKIGLDKISETIDSIWATNRNILREINYSLEELKKIA